MFDPQIQERGQNDLRPARPGGSRGRECRTFMLTRSACNAPSYGAGGADVFMVPSSVWSGLRALPAHGGPAGAPGPGGRRRSRSFGAIPRRLRRRCLAVERLETRSLLSGWFE